MEVTITQTLRLIAILAANMLLAWELGRYLTEERPPLLPFKPFNCRPCFTFWTTLFYTLFTLYALPYLLWVKALAALVAAFVNFFILKLRFKIYE